MVVVTLVHLKLENVVEWISDDIENCWNRKWKCFVNQKREFEKPKMSQRRNKIETFWFLKQKVDNMMELLKNYSAQFAASMEKVANEYITKQYQSILKKISEVFQNEEMNELLPFLFKTAVNGEELLLEHIAPQLFRQLQYSALTHPSKHDFIYSWKLLLSNGLQDLQLNEQPLPFREFSSFLKQEDNNAFVKGIYEKLLDGKDVNFDEIDAELRKRLAGNTNRSDEERIKECFKWYTTDIEDILKNLPTKNIIVDVQVKHEPSKLSYEDEDSEQTPIQRFLSDGKTKMLTDILASTGNHNPIVLERLSQNDCVNTTGSMFDIAKWMWNCLNEENSFNTFQKIISNAVELQTKRISNSDESKSNEKPILIKEMIVDQFEGEEGINNALTEISETVFETESARLKSELDSSIELAVEKLTEDDFDYDLAKRIWIENWNKYFDEVLKNELETLKEFVRLKNQVVNRMKVAQQWKPRQKVIKVKAHQIYRLIQFLTEN